MKLFKRHVLTAGKLGHEICASHHTRGTQGGSIYEISAWVYKRV
ncbi:MULTISPECIES: hypothetical protein [unclassified Paludibacterium]|nr:hypothetical protein [Paludibacterium sp. B53371]